MSSRGSVHLAHVRTILLLAAVLGIGIFAIRMVLVRAADRVLDRWEDVGLPGSRPTGSGPVLTAVWPPLLRWSNVAWREGTIGTARCQKLEIAVDPGSIFRGALRATRLRIDGLQIESSQAFPRWLDPVLMSLSAGPGGGPGVAKPQPDAIWFEVHGLRLASIPRELPRVEGWGWSQRRGSWQAIAEVAVESQNELRLRVQGSGVGGSEEVVLDADLAEHRTVRFVWERSPDEAVRWNLAGRDDGSLLLALLSSSVVDSVPPFTGIIDFEASGGSGGMIAGVIQIHELSIGAPAETPWKLSGCLSVDRGAVLLDDLSLSHGNTRGRVSGKLHSEPVTGPRRWTLAGDWGGVPFRAEGAVDRQENPCVLRIDEVNWRGERGGPAELSGRGSSRDPVTVRAASIPVSWMIAWLPLSLPGHWTGLLAGQGEFFRVSEGWKGRGRAEIRGVRIVGLPPFDEIGALLGGERGRGAVDLNGAKMQWAFDAGHFLADSLLVDGRAAQLSGLLLGVMPDSVFGVLRVTPSSDRLVGTLLRLLGGDEAAIDIGIAGRASDPQFVPLDASDRRLWLDKLAGIRRRFPL